MNKGSIFGNILRKVYFSNAKFTYLNCLNSLINDIFSSIYLPTINKIEQYHPIGFYYSYYIVYFTRLIEEVICNTKMLLLDWSKILS